MAVDDPKGRPLGGTEYSLCRAVPGGSGITVVGLLLSHPPNLPSLQNTLHKLQNSHPILRCKLQNATTPSPSFSISTSPSLQIQTFDLPATTNLLKTLSPQDPPLQIPPFHLLLEHQLNQNPWSQQPHSPTSQVDVFHATLYSLSESRWVLALRLHGSVCDRTSAVVLAREVVGLMREGEGGAKWETGEGGCGGDVGLAIEELVPMGKGDKPVWARAADLIGYPLNYMRTASLGFEDVCVDRRTEVVRFQLERGETDELLSKCREIDIKLSGAIAAAALIAANSSKHLPNNQSENYAVLTLVDCRKSLDPAPLDHHLGFYHSGILNTQSITKGERLWDVAERCYMAFSNALKCNKHYTDMGVLNFLMCKAIENPGLTPSSSMRASYIAVFEDPVIDDSCELHQEVGLEDYLGCASVHGFGPSIVVSDTIRNGCLDCSCVYPSPLHSRKQMQELIDEMKKILVGGGD